MLPRSTGAAVCPAWSLRVLGNSFSPKSNRFLSRPTNSQKRCCTAGREKHCNQGHLIKIPKPAEPWIPLFHNDGHKANPREHLPNNSALDKQQLPSRNTRIGRTHPKTPQPPRRQPQSQLRTSMRCNRLRLLQPPPLSAKLTPPRRHFLPQAARNAQNHAYGQRTSLRWNSGPTPCGPKPASFRISIVKTRRLKGHATSRFPPQPNRERQRCAKKGRLHSVRQKTQLIVALRRTTPRRNLADHPPPASKMASIARAQEVWKKKRLASRSAHKGQSPPSPNNSKVERLFPSTYGGRGSQIRPTNRAEKGRSRGKIFH